MRPRFGGLPLAYRWLIVGDAVAYIPFLPTAHRWVYRWLIHDLSMAHRCFFFEISPGYGWAIAGFLLDHRWNVVGLSLASGRIVPGLSPRSVRVGGGDGARAGVSGPGSRCQNSGRRPGEATTSKKLRCQYVVYAGRDFRVSYVWHGMGNFYVSYVQQYP